MVGRIEPKANEKTTEAIGKVKLGNTTFWNAKPNEVVSSIINDASPTFVELKNAIVTPRSAEGKVSGLRKSPIRYAQGGVYDADRKLLPIFLERESFEESVSSMNRLRNDPVLQENALVNAKKISGTYVFLGILRVHFGHFLLESLSRIWYLLKADPEIKVIVHWYDKREELPSYVRHIFELLDLSFDRVIASTSPLIVENLIVPESEFEIRWKAHSSFANLFKELHERNARKFAGTVAPERIYLTRRQLSIKNDADRKKSVSNEAAIEAIFKKKGFKIYAPETLPFPEQIAMFGNAVEIAGMKGSALHMSLFNQRAGARVIQIAQTRSVNQCLIDGLKNMESHHIFCKTRKSDAGSIIKLETIRTALQQI